jgi:hypothetical protein
MRENIHQRIALFLILTLIITLAMTALGSQKQERRVIKPDLEVVKIFWHKGEEIRVQVRNNGPGRIPDAVYSAPRVNNFVEAVPLVAGYYYNTHYNFVLHVNDPDKKLQEPGGEMTWFLMPFRKGQSVQVSLKLDTENELSESDETNNVMEEVFRTKPLPDLIVDGITPINLNGKCRIKMRVMNGGTAGVSSQYYGPLKLIMIKMYRGNQPWGGMTLNEFDPQGKLKKINSQVWHAWCPSDPNLLLGPGIHNLKVVVDESNIIDEIFENNNSIRTSVPCQLPPPKKRKVKNLP